ncbi:MAG: GNAT family N-acetyltransferase [Caulobacterales bacterium]|nr:GNAT family N-acetyltransferase [Caulobacterales bacterium]
MAEIRTATEADQSVLDAIVAPLAAFTREKGFAFSPEAVTLVVEEDGEVRGGLTAEIAWRWMYVRLLSVSEALRGRGLGRDLMLAAEDVARERACVGVWVDTFTFQSPGFYERLGYAPFGQLDDYPPGETRIFFCKRL